MREILFKRFHFNSKDELIAVTFWGKIDQDLEPSVGCFMSPSSIGSSVRHIDCQFTGLPDKNGNKIFEGDTDKKGRVCEYFPKLGSFGFKHPNYAAITFLGEWTGMGGEIIGNIHQKEGK